MQFHSLLFLGGREKGARMSQDFFLGTPFYHLKEVDSTNSYLKRNAAELPHGTCLMADRQTAGRGRLSRTWNTQEGALAMSVLLRRPVTEPETLPLVCALGVIHGLSQVCGWDPFSPRLPLGIKWPNDILLLLPGSRIKKLCGILCEAAICGEERFHVCGIGVNLRQDPNLAVQIPHAGFLEELAPLPSREQLAKEICRQLEKRLELPFSSQREEYQQRCVNLGRAAAFQHPSGLKQGVAVGITSQGRLLVDCQGQALELNAGECSVQGIYGASVEP